MSRTNRGRRTRQAGTLAGARRSVTGDQPRAQVGIGDQSLDGADARPVVGLLELRVRESEVQRAVQIVAVVLGGISQQVGIRSRQALIVRLRVGQSLSGGGKNNNFARSSLAGHAETQRIFIVRRIVRLICESCARAGGRSNHGEELFALLTKYECVLRFVPVEKCPSEAAGHSS